MANQHDKENWNFFVHIIIYTMCCFNYKSEHILNCIWLQLQTQVCFGSKPEHSMNDSLVSALGEILDWPAVQMTSLFFKAVGIL